MLVTRPDTNAYGNAALNMATSFHLSRHLGASLYVAPVNPLRHQALTALECAGVRRLPTSRLGTGVALALSRLLATRQHEPYFGLDLRRTYAQQPIEVRLPARAATAADATARALGLDGRRLVTLHVRESGYKASLGIVDREKDTARNAHLGTYLDAIDWLAGQGYTVVRFGDPQMTPLRHPGVIDLATSPERTPELEIWCVLRSRFFIASDAGPYNLSVLTGVPCLGVNITHHIGAYPLRAHDRYLLKHVVDEESGRTLPLAEMFTRGHLKQRWAPGRYRFIDNTPGEIMAAVEEIERVVAQGPTEASPAQRAFRGLVQGFLDSDYGRSRQQKGNQPPFYLGDGWICDAFVKGYAGLTPAPS